MKTVDVPIDAAKELLSMKMFAPEGFKPLLDALNEAVSRLEHSEHKEDHVTIQVRITK